MKTFVVDAAWHDQRLDKYVSGMLTISRTLAQSLFEQGKVLVDGKERNRSYRIREHETVSVDIGEREDLFYQIYTKSESIPILYEDEDIIVVNKPFGITVHPLGVPRGDTLVEALQSMGKSLFSFQEKRKGIVHRLDKETSGVMVLAQSKRAYLNLIDQFKKRKIKKFYIAVVEGIVNQAEKVIDYPLKRQKNKINKMQVDQFGEKEAVTYMRVIQRFSEKNETLVVLKPLTGRTHQIRVHLSYEAHPVLGDKKYGAKHSFPRVLLHAYQLTFKHPSEKEQQTYTAPLPDDLLAYLKQRGIIDPERAIAQACQELQEEQEAIVAEAKDSDDDSYEDTDQSPNNEDID